MHPLDGPRAKLDRAAEHIQEFDAAVRRWNNSKTFRTVSEQFNSDKTEYIYRFEFGSIPVRIGIIAGDALHNLRSSLDYLVWQLALLTTGHPGTETAFPICLTDGEASQKRIKTLLKHVPNDAREIIKDLQPYNTRDELKPELHILWLLHRLSIIDKHQFVTVPIAHGKKPVNGGNCRQLNARRVQLGRISIAISPATAGISNNAQIMRLIL